MDRFLQKLGSTWMPLLIGGIAVAALLAGTSTCRAGILTQDGLRFDAADLDRALSDNAAGAATSTSPSRSPQQQWPPSDNDRGNDPLGFLKSSLPTGSSSSTSTSSSGGAVGSGVVLCLFNSTITFADESPLGRLVEERGLTLPAPPGTDLLRPPRA